MLFYTPTAIDMLGLGAWRLMAFVRCSRKYIVYGSSMAKINWEAQITMGRGSLAIY